MEKIKINGIEPKFGKPNDQGVCTPFWAIQFDNRKGTVWDAQIADYMMKDVGIGGECMVEIKVTPQGYNNIRAVDMTSAVKGNVVNEAVKPLASSRENSIIAQCCMKASISTMPEPVGVDACVRMYKEALKLLEE